MVVWNENQGSARVGEVYETGDKFVSRRIL